MNIRRNCDEYIQYIDSGDIPTYGCLQVPMN